MELLYKQTHAQKKKDRLCSKYVNKKKKKRSKRYQKFSESFVFIWFILFNLTCFFIVLSVDTYERFA